jgi:Fe-S cluster assembly iron-binding protein IscA
MVTYSRVKAILVFLGITVRLFVRGVGCNDSDYNIELVCESCY